MHLKIVGIAFAAALLMAFATSLQGTGNGTVEATVHPINSAECAAPPADGTAADTQSPPGISDPTKDNFLQPLASTIFVGVVEALNGDNGDDHCVFPETTSHGNAPPPSADEHAGEDGTLPTGNPLPGQGP